MSKRMKWLTAFGILAALLAAACAVAAEPLSMPIAVSISTRGTPPEAPETYTVRMTADEAGNPMPEGAKDGVYDLTISGAASVNEPGAGQGSFPGIVFDRVGIYTYTIRQIAGTAAGAEYDSTAYTLKVTVSNRTGGGFDVTPVARRQGQTVKTTDVSFINSYAVEKTEKTVVKNWDDADNQDGKRPESVTATLWREKRDGEPEEMETVVLNAENGWTVSVGNLDRYEDNTRDEITYSWTEGSVTAEYVLAGTETEGNVTTITNRHQPETVSAEIEKIWDDADDQDGIRPKGETTLRVFLTGNGADVRAVYLTEEGSWRAEIGGLPKYAAGQEISYSFEERESDIPTGYALSSVSTVQTEEGWRTILVNRHETDRTTATVVKVWDDGNNQDGIRPETLSVTLSANGGAARDSEGNDVPAVVLSEENGWSATVGNLPLNAGGRAIQYAWREAAEPNGYRMTASETSGTITTITNTHAPEEREITVEKVWAGEEDEEEDAARPEVTLVLTATANGSTVRSYTFTAGGENGLSRTFTVPVYDRGVRLDYALDEESVPAGYVKSVSGHGNTMTVTNTRIRQPALTDEAVEILVTKAWVDDGDRDGLRPDNITVSLTRNGAPYATATVTGTGDLWSCTFENLPKYTDGAENVYAVAESAVPGYTGTVTGFAITNTHEIQTMNLSVRKIWNDNDDLAGRRPDSVRMTLSANGTAVNTVTLSENNNWRATVTNLPVNQAGARISYTWIEAGTEGYTRTGTRVTPTADGTLTTITNTWNEPDEPIPVHRITVSYRYLTGGEAAPDTTLDLPEGEGFDIPSPEIPGYRPSMVRITGTVEGRDASWLVIYVPGGTSLVTLDELDTPLGLGSVIINEGECLE